MDTPSSIAEEASVSQLPSSWSNNRARSRFAVLLSEVSSEALSVLCCSKANLFLLLVPVGFILNYLQQDPALVFSINLIAIIGPAAIIEYAVKGITEQSGQLLGQLLSMTFSNVVQLINSIMLLKKSYILVLQTSLVGGLLSNMHLMLGLGFLAGGLKHSEQSFNVHATKEMGTLLVLSVASIMIPTMFSNWSMAETSDREHRIAAISRGIAVICLMLYISFVFFQTSSHRPMFDLSYPKPGAQTGEETTVSDIERIHKAQQSRKVIWSSFKALFQGNSLRAQEKPSLSDLKQALIVSTHTKTPRMEILAIALGLATTLIGFNSTFATNNLEDMMKKAHISSAFIGTVVLPVVSNDLGPIKAAMNNRMDECISSTIGKCVQQALIIIPLTVLISWGMGDGEMALDFDGYQVGTLFSSCIYVNFLIINGSSNYFEGVALIALFAIVSLSAWYF